MTETSQPRITIWNEFRHEQLHDAVRAVYPDGIHRAIADGLREHGLEARTSTLDDPDLGLGQELLDGTDVLLYWAHMAHREVSDEVAERVVRRVWDGMGLVMLHSGHFSKVFKRLMGTGCDLKWREGHDKERLWVVAPGHPITQGLGEFIELEHEEMYGEPFDVPPPETLIFVSWFTGGEVFRSGGTYTRGAGRIFYFRPGHETFPTFYHPDIRRVLANAARWAAPTPGAPRVWGNSPPLEGAVLEPEVTG